MDVEQDHNHRTELKDARDRLGWGQEQAAEAMRVSVSTWSRWERGVQDVRPAHRARLAEVFGTTVQEVSRWFGARPAPAPEGGRSGRVGDTVRDALELWASDADVGRRDALRALPFSPETWPELLLGWGLDADPESREHTGRRRRVGMPDVRRVQEATRAFAAMDRRHGGGLVRPAVVDHLHTRVAPLLAGTYPDRIGAALLAAAAAMTGLAGWEAYDLRLDGLAQRHYGQALRLAKAAGDPMTSAWVLTVMSQQAIDLGLPVWAVRLARAARGAGRTAAAPPRVRAALALREARATALRVELAGTPDEHTARRVRRLLGEVETAFAQASPGDEEPDWISDLGPAEIAAEAGCAWRMIGDARRAAACAREALAGFGAAYPRSVQFNVVHQAQALARLGEIDEAVAVARRAVPMANGLTSRRARALLRSFAAELAPHGDSPAVREWREYLRTALHPAA
ncbi:helix-turn-helix domain-containing protein [Actinocorallia populi]|uniref:helix-turn-helix domain-containing protein n=1 Tax=Actinocorallia populi TaxID=2079200 RepID=UPI000D08826F|nr:helix-turn-helix transcriptional regulator [Actinocorallia populi]